jgi:hypothetical protein
VLIFGGATWVAGCQKQADRAPFAAGCESDCMPVSGVAIGSGTSTPITIPVGDAGFDAGTLTGNVLLLADDTFRQAVSFANAATVSGDGTAGTSVTAPWDGADPYQLTGVAVAPVNWVQVTPTELQGDAVPTIQAVATNATGSADLAVVDGTVIDGVLTAVSQARAPDLAQVVVFLRSAGTGAPLVGVRAVLTQSSAPAYSVASGWVLQDDTTTTSSSGLVVFGNVDLPLAGASTQIVTLDRPATVTTPAAAGGQFAVKVVAGAVTLVTLEAQL